MGTECGRPDRMRSALFVDFDNIYICLEERHGKETAQCFGNQVEKWVEWIERHAAGISDSGLPCRRKLLVRRCYMNPEKFADYRNKFTLAAFEVVDCPKLTDQGKTCTDMHLVIDVLDALAHPVHIDEFIILSGDADFTPLLLRLRRHDRLTAIFPAGYASAAYKAASDRIIPVDDFISEGLMVRRGACLNDGHAPHPPAASAAPVPAGGVTPAAGPPAAPDVEADPHPPARNGPVGDPPQGRIPGVRPGPKSSFPRLNYLVSKIHDATRVPKLLRSEYAMLFKALADEINSNGFQTEETSRAVQRRCADKHVTVMQGQIESIMEGCHRADYWFTRGKETPEAIAQGYLAYVEELCRKAGLQLSEIELVLLQNWITGKRIPHRVRTLAN